MSEQNVEVVRRAFEATARRDYEAALADVDPAVEIDDLDISLDTDHYQGHESFRKWISIWDESWESWRVDELDFVPAEDEQVVALFLMTVKGRGSGIELERRDAVLYKLRGGKIVKLGYYNDQRQALDAAGLVDKSPQ
jgi:ketosteroid isomerase-like protein